MIVQAIAGMRMGRPLRAVLEFDMDPQPGSLLPTRRRIVLEGAPIELQFDHVGIDGPHTIAKLTIVPTKATTAEVIDQVGLPGTKAKAKRKAKRRSTKARKTKRRK